MKTSKGDTPAVTAFKDYEVIVPANPLKKALARSTSAQEDPVARAEAALATLSTEFAGWMDAECTRLESARREAVKNGLTPALRDQLFRAAHDIKGEAETFGFPYAGHVADSLCRLLEHTPQPGRVPLMLIERHVDAVRAIIREAKRPSAEAMARELSDRLKQLVDECVAQQPAGASVAAPPLVPGQ